MPTIVIDPITRVEGHLKLTAVVDANNVVTEARIAGTLYRDFENILTGRHVFDAVALTQRICGVCPVSHSIASTKAIEASIGFQPNSQAILLRSLIQGGNFLQDHILHFYHLNLVDYIDGPGMPPWTPAAGAPMRITGAAAQALLDHYLEALAIRRKGQEMVAILAGKVPHIASIKPGGVTQSPSAAQMTQFKAYLAEIRAFIANRYLPDVEVLAAAYPDHFALGKGPGNFLSYGVFDQPGTTPLLKRGRLAGATAGTVDPKLINEYVKYSYYSSATGQNPSVGTTTPLPDKAGAYTFLKAPRYQGGVYEAGSLARMKVAGKYTGDASVMDRIRARALETKLIGDAMVGWANQVVPGASAYTNVMPASSGTGLGMTEAPRGALGHWATYSNYNSTRYQIITPTCWNASPKDDAGNPGAIERALVGTKVADPGRPIELVRIIRSFDPCTGCAVHVIEPENGVSHDFVLGPLG